MTRPGELIRALASLLCSAETMQRVIDPIVADMQCEYGGALAHRSRWRARLTLVRSYLGLGSAMARLGVRYLCDPRIGNPGSEFARTWMVSLLALAVFTGALVLPGLTQYSWSGPDAGFRALLSITLVPQALPLSIPVAMCVGVLWAARGSVANRTRLCTVLVIAFMCTATVWVVLEWSMPQANQRFRELVAERINGRVVTIQPGLSELGLSRLGQRSDPAAVRHYHRRWALCFATLPLCLFALGLAGYVRRGASAVALAIALSFCYLAAMAVFERTPTGSVMPVFLRAWMPNVLFLLIACALLLRSGLSRARPHTPGR
jgi:lipopolysaccharide export LptBFGC system permease protein LptF